MLRVIFVAMGNSYSNEQVLYVECTKAVAEPTTWIQQNNVTAVKSNELRKSMQRKRVKKSMRSCYYVAGKRYLLGAQQVHDWN